MDNTLDTSNNIFALDSSLKPSVTISEENYKDTIFNKLQLVLNHVFKNDHARCQIKKGYDRWNFACPFCGDSASVAYKKRGNFIFKQGPFYNRYKCFNCGISMPISKFFKEFNTELPYEVNDYILATVNDHIQSSSTTEYVNSMFNATEMKEYGIRIDDFIQRCNLQRVSKDNKNNAYYYLIKRLQFDFSRFLYDPQGDILLILNTIEDKVISFQMKRLSETKKNNGPKYLTVSLKMIHEKILQDNKEVSPEFDALSMIYNLYNVNLNRPVLATEGPLDGFLLPNCISTLGANKNVSIGVPLWYVYDDDKTGRGDAIKKLEKGNNVFMWTKLKQEYGLPERKKWDINDFFIWCKENNRTTPKTWKQYFTNDSLDILDI